MNKKYIVEKSNTLNSLMQYDITLTELRFFCLYLSRLNSRMPDSRHVEISIKEFENFFDVKVNTTLFSKKIKKIAGRTVEIRENGKIKVLTLYSEFCWSEKNPTSLSIICNDRMLPYLFELQNTYTSYTIGNISKLTTVSQIRLYELCKQYQKIKTITFEFEEIKSLLCSSINADFRHFRVFTLVPSIDAVNEHTDVKVSFEKITSGRKVTAIKFFIDSKNNGSLSEQEEPEAKQIEASEPKNLKDLYRKYFSDEQDELIKETIITSLKSIYSTKKMLDKRSKAIYDKSVSTFKVKAKVEKIRNPLAYMNGIINNLIDDEMRCPHRERTTSYDLSEIEKCAINAAELEEIEKIERGEISDIKKQAVQAITEPAEEDKVTIPEKVETTDSEPAETCGEVLEDETESYSEYFTTEKEELDLYNKAVEVIENMPSYELAVKTLDILDKRWRNFDGFFKIMITDKLAEKTGAPELVEI